MTEDHVFPEDKGTGASKGDDADAANFAAHAQHDNLSNYKATGLQVTANFGSNTFDVSAGKVFLKDQSATATQSGESRDQGVLYAVEVAEKTVLSFTDNETISVYLSVNLSNDDDVTVQALSSGTPATSPHLKIAEIDATTNTVDNSFNEAPSVKAEVLDVANRTINFGSDETEATYQVQDDSAEGGNFVINDTDTATTILEYDQTNDEWLVQSIVADGLNGADLSTASEGAFLASTGTGDLAFQQDIETYATFDDLPTPQPATIVYVQDENEYYKGSAEPAPYDVTAKQEVATVGKDVWGASIQGLALSDDGTTLVVADFPTSSKAGDNFRVFDLSTPFDITTASLSSVETGEQDASRGVEFADDGNKFYDHNYGVGVGPKIYQYSLSTPFDITTKTLDGDDPLDGAFIEGIDFNDDGTKFYVSADFSSNIHQYSLSTPYDILTAGGSEATLAAPSTGGIEFNSDGSQLIHMPNSSGDYDIYDLSTPYDLSTASSPTTVTAGVTNFTFSNDGTRLYEDDQQQSIIQYDLVSLEWNRSRYSDSEAKSAVDNSNVNVDKVDGFDIQKNGTDGNGIINFKTN